jgi:hypothetical protein
MSAEGTVELTILIMPPPTSFLYFTRASSGSTPVVSQSIMNPMVPVGASTVTCELRKPCRLTVGEGAIPGVAAGCDQLLQLRDVEGLGAGARAGDGGLADVVDLGAVHADDVEERLAVDIEAWARGTPEFEEFSRSAG